MFNCNRNREEYPMAIQIAPLVGAGLGALQQSKIDKALAGEKTYTKPKTIFGKLIGGISGRSAAAEASASVKTAPLSSAVMNSLQPTSSNLDPSMRQSFPVTGGVQFGTQAKSRPWLPYAIVAGIVAIFYFMRGKKGRRRRY
jgi:hypothetical protein